MKLHHAEPVKYLDVWLCQPDQLSLAILRAEM